MGLFGKLLGKEGAPAKEQAAEQPKAEKRELRAESGRERVRSIIEGAKDLWAKLKGGASSLKEKAKTRGAEAYSMVLGKAQEAGSNLVEGAFATVGAIEAGVEYTAETGREAMEIKDLAVEAAKDKATRTKEAAVEAAYEGAALAFMGTEAGIKFAQEMKRKGIDLASETARKVADGAARLTEMGIDATLAFHKFGADKIDAGVDRVVKTAEEAQAAGIDLKQRGSDYVMDMLDRAVEAGFEVGEAIEGVAGEILEKGREIVGNAVEKMDELQKRANEAGNRFFARIGQARDNAFRTGIKMLVDAMAPQLQEIVRKEMDARDAMANADIEYDEEDDEVVEYVSR